MMCSPFKPKDLNSLQLVNWWDLFISGTSFFFSTPFSVLVAHIGCICVFFSSGSSSELLRLKLYCCFSCATSCCSIASIVDDNDKGVSIEHPMHRHGCDWDGRPIVINVDLVRLDKMVRIDTSEDIVAAQMPWIWRCPSVETGRWWIRRVNRSQSSTTIVSSLHQNKVGMRKRSLFLLYTNIWVNHRHIENLLIAQLILPRQ